MEIYYQGTYQPEDVKQASQIVAGRSQKGFLAYLSVIVLSLWLPLLVGARPFTFATVAPALIITGLSGFYLYVTITAPRRALRQSPILKGPIEGNLNEYELVFGGEFFTYSVQWRGFIQYRYTENILLIFPSGGSVYMLPRRFFGNEAEWNNALRLVENKVASTSSATRENRRLTIILFIFLSLIALFNLLPLLSLFRVR